jgi:hypothetical protein
MSHANAEIGSTDMAREGSGLVVPGGIHSAFFHDFSQPYLQIKEKALAIEQLYADSNVELPATCDLARLIADAKVLIDSWLINGLESLPLQDYVAWAIWIESLMLCFHFTSARAYQVPDRAYLW